MRGFLAFVLLAGCESTSPSWDLARPAAPAQAAPVAAAPVAAAPGSTPVAAPEPATAAPAPAVGFDFEGNDRPADEPVEQAAPSAESPLELQARLLGIALPERGATPGASPGVPDVPPTVSGFGVRVISILADVQPPMAVLGLSTGTEVVVRPGTMLPEVRLVVLAIGRSAVQVAEIVPEGFSTKVSTITVPALYPVTPAGLPAVP